MRPLTRTLTRCFLLVCVLALPASTLYAQDVSAPAGSAAESSDNLGCVLSARIALRQFRASEGAAIRVGPIAESQMSIRMLRTRFTEVTVDGDTPRRGVTREFIPLRLSHPVSLSRVVTLPRETSVQFVRARPSGLEVNVRLGSLVEIRNLRLGCGDVEVGSGVALTSLESPLSHFHSRGASLTLEPEPRSSGGVRLRILDQRAATFVEVARDDNWVRLQCELSNGASVLGWARVDELVRVVRTTQ